uniref:Uncharacterized protein n=1 Tax=Moriarty virus TaxID=2600342 RepID=A0A5B8X9Y2_9VIRU|nr:hypothetical protein 1 [Moriarty virus]
MLSTYSVPYSSAPILVKRRRTDIRRVEEYLNGMLDSLLLFDLDLFKEGPGRKILRHLVRKCLIVGTYSVMQMIKYWKELSSFLYNRLAGLVPKAPFPPKANFVAQCLLKWPKVRRIIDQDIDKQLLESFAHLVSSRQLPSGDKRAERASLTAFFNNVEEPYIEDIAFSRNIGQLAERVAEKCIALNTKLVTRPHISLSCAGSYYHTVRQGGRGKEIRDALTRIMTVVPKEPEFIQTPFETLVCPAGGERWRYWCRKEPYTHYPGTPFGAPIKEEVFAELNLYYQGFDEAVGCQILVCAYLDYLEWSATGEPIPCRVLTVPEPGGKARIVTTGPYWLNILQQSVSHVMKDILKGVFI